MGDSWKGDIELECPVGVKGIEIEVWDTQAKHEKGEATKCTFLIEQQTIKGVVYNNETMNGDVTIEGKGLFVMRGPPAPRKMRGRHPEAPRTTATSHWTPGKKRKQR